MIKKIYTIVVVGLALTACGSKSTTETAEGQHVHTEECGEHGHEHEGHSHNHCVKVAGVAQVGDAASGKITIKKLHGGETVTYDYSKSNQDQIAAWLEGDTVTIFVDSHQHGTHSHEVVTKIKIGNFECAEHNHEAHNHSHGEGCNHQH